MVHMGASAARTAAEVTAMAKERKPGTSRFVWEEGDIEIVSPGPKYPEIKVRLVGRDGNAFNVLGIVQRAMKDAGLPPEEIATFMAEATAGTYDALLQTVLRWVSAE